jgi:hypothetical protein
LGIDIRRRSEQSVDQDPEEEISVIIPLALPPQVPLEIKLIQTTQHVHRIIQPLVRLVALMAPPNLAKVPERGYESRLRGPEPVQHGQKGVDDLAAAVVRLVREVEDDGEGEDPCCCEREGAGGLGDYDGVVPENLAALGAAQGSVPTLGEAGDRRGVWVASRVKAKMSERGQLGLRLWSVSL